MLRYVGASAVAKAFSLTPATRHSYRALGNELETWRRLREGLPDRYIQRARLLVLEIVKYLDSGPSRCVLEVGTGWVHWESLILSLASDVQPTLVDIVDNRLFSVFQLYAAELEPQLTRIGLPNERTASAKAILNIVRVASSFEEVYSELSWNYVLDASGTMRGLPEDSFDFVVSSDVLEHIDRNILQPFIDKMFKLMRPGGLMIHDIDLTDHLSYYDSRAPSKLYYRFSGATWDRWINSRVQYINRVQDPEWLSVFRQAGFDLVSHDVEYESHGVPKVHSSYSYLTQTELDTSRVRMAFRKPI